jgi:predicted enzyme related to lactoylglutathione lyase
MPLFRTVDGVQLPVPDLDAGLAFYRNRLGHELVWRTATQVGLRLPESNTEIVLQTERPTPEIDLLVDAVDAALATLVEAGASILVPPFDIRIGRCAVVVDPWGNRLTLLDQSKGVLLTDAQGSVIGVTARAPASSDHAQTASASATGMAVTGQAWVVIISGAIACGKTTLAATLAERLREQGRSAAVVELDRLYLLQEDRAPMADLAIWQRARMAAGALSQSLVASGVDVVIVDGDFWDEPQRVLLLGPIAAPHQMLVVTLVVPFDEALRRVQLDPARRDSRNPTVLARNHAEFQATLARARASGDLILDTTQTSPAALTEAVVARLPALFGSSKSIPG